MVHTAAGRRGLGSGRGCGRVGVRRTGETGVVVLGTFIGNENARRKKHTRTWSLDAAWYSCFLVLRRLWPRYRAWILVAATSSSRPRSATALSASDWCFVNIVFRKRWTFFLFLPHRSSGLCVCGVCGCPCSPTSSSPNYWRLHVRPPPGILLSCVVRDVRAHTSKMLPFFLNIKSPFSSFNVSKKVSIFFFLREMRFSLPKNRRVA